MPPVLCIKQLGSPRGWGIGRARIDLVMRRRGFKGRVRSIDEERRLNEVILRVTSELGEPARLSFDAPDAIVVVETVGNRGGISLWAREQLERWPLLHLD